MRHPPKLTRRSRGLAGAFALAAALGACLSPEDIDLGRNVDAGARAQAGDGAGAVETGDDEAIMSAAIDATEGTICPGQCVDLFASASGGAPPYTFSWGEDLGEGPGPKHVCPVATTTYSVVVGSSTSAQSTASAMVTVADCDAEASPPSDSGAAAPDGAGPAGGTARSLCLDNPSFEGTPVAATGETGGPPGTLPADVPPDWQACLGTPDDDPSAGLLPAQDGKSYVGLPVGSGSFSDLTASVGAALCAPLQAGQSYSFCLDVGVAIGGVMPPSGGPAPVLEVWGGGASCAQDELLWTSPAITNADSWKQVCGSFVPSQALSEIVLLPALAAGATGTGWWSYVVVDHIVAGP